MTPAVRDIVIDARKKVHAEIGDRSCVSDTHVMLTLDQLIVADAASDLASVAKGEVTCGLSEDTPNPYEEAERKELEEKLKRLEHQRDQDDKLIKGLQDELRKRKGGM